MASACGRPSILLQPALDDDVQRERETYKSVVAVVLSLSFIALSLTPMRLLDITNLCKTSSRPVNQHPLLLPLRRNRIAP